MIDERILRLAGDFLNMAAERFGRDGCNEWEFPEDWTEEQCRDLVWTAEAANGTPGEYNPQEAPFLANWQAMYTVGAILRGKVEWPTPNRPKRTEQCFKCGGEMTPVDNPTILARCVSCGLLSVGAVPVPVEDLAAYRAKTGRGTTTPREDI